MRTVCFLVRAPSTLASHFLSSYFTVHKEAFPDLAQVSRCGPCSTPRKEILVLLLTFGYPGPGAQQGLSIDSMRQSEGRRSLTSHKGGSGALTSDLKGNWPGSH